MKSRTAERVPSLAIITSQAFSLHNFRGPLIRELVRRGHAVFALAPDYDAASRSAVIELGAKPIDFSLSRAGINPVRDLADSIGLTRCLSQLRPDVTLSYFIKPVIYGTIAARIAGVQRRFALVPGLGYVFTMSAPREPLRRNLLQRLVARMYGVAFKRCERVFFQNNDDAEWFVSRGWLDPGKVFRINGTGIDLTEWSPAPFDPGGPVFLLIARLLLEKGILDFVEAARRVKARHPTARFILVGGIDANPGALTTPQVEAWVRDGVIEWPGHVDDVRPWIARCHVYVLPSYREGMPRSTQEAMAMGRAVITTDTAGCRETVKDGLNGFLVPVRCPGELANAMERFIERPSLIESMGQESRSRAEQRFDVRQINARLIEAMALEGELPPGQ